MKVVEILPNALLVEDDPEDRLAIRLQLEVMGFAVFDTPQQVEALEMFKDNEFNLVLIHLTHLPLRSLEICRFIRAASTVPIIMLTRRDEVVDEEMCLRAGADDYVTKPIENKILISRITQQMKRGESQRSPKAHILTWGTLKMDLVAHEFWVQDRTLELTSTEFQFLQLLMEDPQRVFSRNQILDAIGIVSGYGSDHIVDTHASRLRLKIRKNGGPEVINVIRSVGFRLSNPRNESQEAIIA
jgi:DNA-binding response OmpR family regulator